MFGVELAAEEDRRERWLQAGQGDQRLLAYSGPWQSSQRKEVRERFNLMSCVSHFESGVKQRQKSSCCTRRIIGPPASDLDMEACPFSMAPDQKYPVHSRGERDTDDPVSSL